MLPPAIARLLRWPRRSCPRTGLSIEKFLESPFASKHPKLISKGTKTAAAEAAVTAAEAIAVADLEEANRLTTEFEALGGGALTIALA